MPKQRKENTPTQGEWFFAIAPFVLSLLVVVGAVVWLWNWGAVERDNVFLDIESSRESELALPVFAQFTMTQTIEFQSDALISQLVLPMYAPDGAQEISIDLRDADGGVLEHWQYQPREFGVIDAVLDLSSPRVLGGKLEVYLEAPLVDHDHKEQAIGLFTESFDEAYPYGNYRIAQNEKSGDISLTFFERVSNWELFVRDLQDDLMESLIVVFKILLLVIFVAIIPHVLVREIFILMKRRVD